jgi:hypothetical protein
VAEVPVPTENISPEPEPLTETVLPVSTSQRSHQTVKLLQVQTNTLALGVSGLVIALGIFGTYCYLVFNPASTAVENVATKPTQLINDSVFTPLVLEEVSAESIITTLAEADTESKIFEGVFVSAATQNAIPPHAILSNITFSVESDFAQTISTARFGYASGNPFILFVISDETAAQGSLLAWENTIYSSFWEIFNAMIVPDEASPLFIDASLNGHDVRVLKHLNGQELLIYGIFGKTVIITNGSASFTTLMNNMK